MSETEMRPTVTRAEAKAAGLPKYFTGKPCKSGHIAERRVSGGNCVVCQDDFRRKWEATNPDRAREMKAASYQRNRDHQLADAARRHAEAPDVFLVRSNRWRSANREKVSAATAARRAKDPESFRQRCQNWRENNPEQSRSHVRCRRAVLAAAAGTHTGEDIKALFVIQKGKCAHPWCRVSLKSGYHVDHVIPLALGGSNDRRNLALLCAPCNVRKNATHPIDFAQRHGMLL